MARRGALARDLGSLTPEQAAERQRRLQGIIDSKGGNAPKAQRRLDRLNRRFGALATDPTVTPDAGVTTQQIDSGVNAQIEQILPNVGNQIDLNQLPQMSQDYGSMRQQAYDNAMGQFERTNAEQFKQQQIAFNQSMADRGIPPGSEAWNREYAALQQAQNSARQNAMSNAFQLGQGEQAQMYNQGLSTRQNAFSEMATNAQLPTQGLNALSGFYGGQQQMNLQIGNQGFLRELEALKNKYALQQIAATPRGGGGGGELSYDQRLALQRDAQNGSLAAQLALLGAQQGQQAPNSAINAGIGGLAQGIGAGITAGLV